MVTMSLRKGKRIRFSDAIGESEAYSTDSPPSKRRQKTSTQDGRRKDREISGIRSDKDIFRQLMHAIEQDPERPKKTLQYTAYIVRLAELLEGLGCEWGTTRKLFLFASLLFRILIIGV